MVSIDALFELLDVIHNGGQLILERRAGGYVALDGCDHSVRGAGDTPTEALEGLAANVLAVAESNAERLATAATVAGARADTAARLAIQAKRVVDGFAQGASE